MGRLTAELTELQQPAGMELVVTMATRLWLVSNPTSRQTYLESRPIRIRIQCLGSAFVGEDNKSSEPASIHSHISDMSAPLSRSF